MDAPQKATLTATHKPSASFLAIPVLRKSLPIMIRPRLLAAFWEKWKVRAVTIHATDIVVTIGKLNAADEVRRRRGDQVTGQETPANVFS